jgi:hypothetical protein
MMLDPYTSACRSFLLRFCTTSFIDFFDMFIARRIVHSKQEGSVE